MKSVACAIPAILILTASPLALAETAKEAGDVIVVSATRSPEALEDVPVSVTRLEARTLSATMAEHPAEIINKAPGAFVQAGSGQEHLTAIRSPVLTGGAGAGSFLYLQDGVPLRSAGFANVNGLFDAMTPFAEAVEVVRGPGDVAYGSNAVHGIVNVLSANPLTAEGGTARLEAGAFDRYSAKAEGAFTLGGQRFFGGAFAYTDGGYRDDSGVDQIKLQLGHGVERGETSIVTRAAFHQLEQETAGFVLGDDAYEDDDLRRTNPNPEAFRDSRNGVISSEITFPAAGGVVQVTPYALATDMAFRLHFLPSRALEENEHWAVGALSSYRREFGATTLLAGLDVEYAEGSLFEIQTIPQVFSYTPGVHYDYTVESTQVAPFARVEHQLTERLGVQAGGRVTHTSYEYDNKTDTGVVGRFQRPEDREDDFTALSGRVAAQYQFAPSLRGFAALSRGARAPQTSDLYRLQINQDVSGVEVETLDMAELGLRYSGEALSAEVVAFTGRKENFAFRDADGFTVDDGETTHEGVEVLVDWTVSPLVAVRLNGTWADHEYDFDRVVGRGSEIITAGNQVDTAPEVVAQTSLILTPTEDLTLSVDWVHVGEYFTDAANGNEYPGHDVVDIAARKELAGGVTLSGEVSNVFDERYATRADFAFGSERYFPGEERAAKVAVTFDW